MNINKLTQETIETVDSLYELHTNKRDRIMRTLGIKDTAHKFLKEENMQINRLAQLKMLTNSLKSGHVEMDDEIEEDLKDVRKQIGFVSFGRKMKINDLEL